jgi:hypothetical protein
MNCEVHDARYHNECQIPESEFVQDRDRSNFCEYFQITSSVKGQSQKQKLDEARNKLNRLFGGG